MLITRRFDFSASHVCRSPQLSEEENRRVYGAAANPNGHGHNYVVDVTLEGEPDPVSGMIMDLKDLKTILRREVEDVYDHRFLNREVESFAQVVPTVENIAIDIWRRIAPCLPAGRGKLHSVRVYETPELFVEYSGDAQ